MFTPVLSIPSPGINYLQLGPIRVYFYALFIITGIFVAVWLTGRRLKAAGRHSAFAVDLALWAVPLGIVAARIYHVVTHPTDYFFPGADLWKVFYIWEGGIAIFGAVLGGLLGIWIASRRAGIPMLVSLDALAPGMLLAQGIGRLGNYFNQELFGAPTTLPWGLQIDPSSPAFPPGLTPETLFHPLFLYELIWNVIGAAVIILLTRAQRFPLGTGRSLGMYLLWYGAGRAWLESFRLDPTELLVYGIKVNLLTALIAATTGVGFLLWSLRTRVDDRSEVPESLPPDEPAVPSEDARATTHGKATQ